MNGTATVVATTITAALGMGARTFIQWYALRRAKQEDVPQIVQTIYRDKRPDKDRAAPDRE